MIVVWSALTIAGVALSFYVAYLLVLVGAYYLVPDGRRPIGEKKRKFAIVIPAHDEELFLPRLLDSVRKQDYPNEMFVTHVIADNCTDNTADIARAKGVVVLERNDKINRGKGHAIKFALETIDLAEYDAVLIVDADCHVGENALSSLDGALEEKKVVQCHNGVANANASWFTRLLDVSRTVNNRIYGPAKQKLGLSSELTGTGMCFSTEILRKYGWDAFTVGEDWEYFAKLIVQGEIVGHCGEAKILHEESMSLKQATSQRMRWSSGRFAVAGRFGMRLLLRGLVERSGVKFDAGLCLVFPNPSLGMNVTLLCLAGAFLASKGQASPIVIWFLILAVAQFGIFVLGVLYTKNRINKFLAIFIAPAFLVWKLGIDALSILGIGRKNWVRTERRL